MTTLQNLFVAKLPRNLTDTDLQKIFDEYHPVSAKIMLDATTGKSKGFGFVLFESEDAGRVAYEKLNKTHVTLQGHSFNLCIFPSKHDGKIANEPSSALYIRNIPRTLSQADVEDFLRAFGPVKYCAMREDHYGANVWVVYTEFETVDCAKTALEQLHGNKTHFPEQVILAKFADSEEAKRERRRRREQHQRDGPPGAGPDDGNGPSVFHGGRGHNERNEHPHNGHEDSRGMPHRMDSESSMPSTPPYASGPTFGFGGAPPPPPGVPRSFSGNFATPDVVVGQVNANSAYGQLPPPPGAPPAGANNNNNLGVSYAAGTGTTPLSQSFLNVTFNASGNHFPSNDRTNPGTPLNFSFGHDADSGVTGSESGSYAAGGAIPSTLSPTNFQPHTPVRRASNLSSSGTYRHNPYAPVTPVTSNPTSGRVSPHPPGTPLQTVNVPTVNPNVPVNQHFATSSHGAPTSPGPASWTAPASPGFAGGSHFSSVSAQAYRAPSQVTAGAPPPPPPPEQSS